MLYDYDVSLLQYFIGSVEFCGIDVQLQYKYKLDSPTSVFDIIKLYYNTLFFALLSTCVMRRSSKIDSVIMRWVKSQELARKVTSVGYISTRLNILPFDASLVLISRNLLLRQLSAKSFYK